MQRRRSIHLFVGAVVVLLVSCTNDPKQTKLLYMPDMASGPMAKPQRSFLAPPLGSVAMDAILYPKDAEEAGRLLENPLAQTKDLAGVRSRGKYLYGQVCVTCHGDDAKGKRLHEDYPPTPDITSGIYPAKADGFFFHRITFGSAVMPFQGDKLDPLERWEVVMYLRELQELQEQSQAKG